VTSTLDESFKKIVSGVRQVKYSDDWKKAGVSGKPPNRHLAILDFRKFVPKTVRRVPPNNGPDLGNTE